MVPMKMVSFSRLMVIPMKRFGMRYSLCMYGCQVVWYISAAPLPV